MVIPRMRLAEESSVFLEFFVTDLQMQSGVDEILKVGIRTKQEVLIYLLSFFGGVNLGR